MSPSGIPTRRTILSTVLTAFVAVTIVLAFFFIFGSTSTQDTTGATPIFETRQSGGDHGYVAILGIANSSTLEESIEITASPEDTADITSVIFFVDGARVSEVNTPPYTYTLNLSSFNDSHRHSLVVIVHYGDGGTSTAQLQFKTTEAEEESKVSIWFRRYIGASGGMMTCMLFLLLNRIRQFAFGVGAQLGEEQLKEKTKGAVITAISKFSKGPFKGPDIIMMLIGLAALAIAFGYAIMRGEIGYNPIKIVGIPTIYPPDFRTDDFLMALPVALLCGGVLIVGAEVIEWTMGKKKDLKCHLTLWPVGLLSLAISSFLFLNPFGYPIKAKIDEGQVVTEKQRGYLALSVALFLGAMMLPFSIMANIEATEFLGKIGLTLSIMLFCYTLVPIKPLEGRFIFRWKKGLWTVMFFSAMGLFVHWNVFHSLLGLYAGTGMLCTLGLVWLFRRDET